VKCIHCGLDRDGETPHLVDECVSRLKLQNEVMENALKEIAGSPSSYLWATLTGIAREALETCAGKRNDVQQMIEAERAIASEVRCDCGIPGCNKLYDHRK
jgi:hypothetical protein